MANQSAVLSEQAATSGWHRYATLIGLVLAVASVAMKIASGFSLAQFLIFVPWLVVLAMPFTFHATRFEVGVDRKLRRLLIVYTVLTIASAAVPLLADLHACGLEECSLRTQGWNEAPLLVKQGGNIAVAAAFGALVALWGVMARTAR